MAAAASELAHRDRGGGGLTDLREELLAELRLAIDPVFLPRPLCLVDQLPRNETGKLPHEALLNMLRAARRS